jgi:hypothetical protein
MRVHPISDYITGWTIWVVIIIPLLLRRRHLNITGMTTTETKLSLTSHFFGTFEGIDSNFVKNNPSYWKTSGIQANFSCRVTDAA